MIALRRRILIETAKLFDSAVMIFSFGLATVLMVYGTQTMSLTRFLSLRIKVQNFVLFGCFLLAWRMIFSAFGLYNSKRLSTHWAEALDVIEGTSVASGTMFLATIVLRIEMATPTFAVLFWAISTTITVCSRLVFRYFVRAVRVRGRNVRYLLVVGTNARAVRFARSIEARLQAGYRLVGFVDDNWPGLSEFLKTGYTPVADLM